MGLISIGDPRSDGRESPDLLPREQKEPQGDGLTGWTPKASEVQKGAHMGDKDVNKRLSTINPLDPIGKSGKCTEKINFVYIKEIKCASQTLVNIFRRFGLERQLSIVTPIGKKLYLGWPWPIQDIYHRPSKTGYFNILCDHTVFDEDLLRSLMEPDVVFITSLREPFAQFKSMFNYYAFQVGTVLCIIACSFDREYIIP